MALPVRQSNKEFENLKIKDQEKQKKLDEYINKVVETINKKDFNPRINVDIDDLKGLKTDIYIAMSDVKTTVLKNLEPKKFWDFTSTEIWLTITNAVLIILLGLVSLQYFKSYDELKKQNENLYKNQKLLYDIYIGESKFWYSKEHKKAFTSSIQNGELENNVEKDK